MTAAGDIVKLVPTLQSVGLVGHNVAYVKKKQKKTKDIVKLGTDNIIGTSLIKANASFMFD